jgi:hypothetical protein
VVIRENLFYSKKPASFCNSDPIEMNGNSEFHRVRRRSVMKWIPTGLIASLVLSGCASEPRRTQAPQLANCYAVPQATNSSAAPQAAPSYAVPQAPPTIAEPSNNPALTRGEPPAQRKSFVDTTAQPFFAHAEDYSWLQGQVEYSHFSKEWRLRYASVDETDSYGGSVTLIENELLHILKDGQHIRVQGQITVDPEILTVGRTSGSAETRKISPHYRVDAVSPVKE